MPRGALTQARSALTQARTATAAHSLVAKTVGYWPLDDTTGAASVGTALTMRGTMTTGPGILRNEARNDGTTSNFYTVPAGSASAYNFTTQSFFFGGWIRLGTITADQTLIAMGDSSGTGPNGLQWQLLRQNSSTRFRIVVVQSDDSSVTCNGTTGGANTLGQRYFVLGWVDRTANTVNLRVNNGAVVTAALTLNLRSSGGPLTIGGLSNAASNSAGGSALNGGLDGMFVGSGIPSKAEQELLFNNGNGIDYPFNRSIPGFSRSISPLQLPGLVLWLDATDSTTLFQDSALTTPATANADPVGGWKDKSGNLNHVTQATAAKRPTLRTNYLNGNSVIRFDTVDDFLRNTGLSWDSGPFSCLAVLSVADTISKTRTVLATGAGSGSLGLMIGNNSPFVGLAKTGVDNRATVALLQQNTTTIAGWTSAAGISGGTANVFGYKNGSIASFTAMSMSSFVAGAGAYIGDYNGGADYLGGDLMELILCTSEITGSQWWAAANYLRQKWGVN